jgi:hypothetical protein
MAQAEGGSSPLKEIEQLRSFGRQLRRFSWVMIWAAIALSIIASVDGILTRDHVGSWWLLLRISAGMIAIVLFYVLLWAREAREILSQVGNGGPEPGGYKVSELAALIDQTIARFDANSVQLYRALAVDYRNSLGRVVERYTLESTAARQEVELQYVFGPEHAKALDATRVAYMPIGRFEKGTLLDNLDVVDGEGRALSILPYKAVLGLQLLVLTNLFEDAYGFTSATQPTSSQPIGDRLAIYNRLLEYVGGFGRADVAAGAQLTKDLKGLVPLKPNLASVLEQFILSSGESYPVVVALPLPERHTDRVIVKYGRNIRLVSFESSWKDKLRAWIGLTEYKFRIPLALPFLAQSYHFRMSMGPGHYVFDQWVQDLDTGERIDDRHPLASLPLNEPAPVAGPRGLPYLRIRRSGTPPFAHLYTRDLNHAKPKRLASIVRFHEIPPGALGTAASLALLAWLFIFAVGSVIRPPEFVIFSANSDIPALILALPALSAAMLGQSLDSQRLHDTSLTTRLGLAFTLVLSALGILLYLFQGQGALRFGIVNLSLFGFLELPVHDVMWMWLMVLSFFNTAWLGTGVVMRTLTYRRLGRLRNSRSNSDVMLPSAG